MNYTKIIEELIPDLENANTLSPQNEDDKEVFKLFEKASFYLGRHEWCKSVDEGWLALAWGHILGVFLFKISSEVPDVDDYVWIVVGDIPPAYIDIESASSANETIECYIEIMSDWVECVEKGESTDECYPIEVPPNQEYATMLKTRLKLLSEELSESLEENSEL